VKSALKQPAQGTSLEVSGARHVVRRNVVMITSPGSEPTRAAVVLNLASVCAEIGQQVAIIRTGEAETAAPQRTAGPPTGDDAVRRQTEPLGPHDVQDLLERTDVPAVSVLDMRHFVAHPTQVVIRVPEVLNALRDLVDVVLLDVPSFLTVHHGQGLAPIADVVLVVGERKSTTLDQLQSTSAILKRLGAPVVGLALTQGVDARVDEWADFDREVSSAKKPRGDGLARHARDGTAEGPRDDTAVTTGWHRNRRAVVEHPPEVRPGEIELPVERDSATVSEA
jgi:Mrp family chromosome partitioning ATPase